MAQLITGATGFVGGAIALELLEQTHADIVCVVRPRGTTTPTERLHRSLTEAAEAYGRIDLLPDILTRTHAVPGDITESLPSRSEIGRVDAVWHCAASLRFEDQHVEDIERHNIHGTQAVLKLARDAQANSFNHVSTAYVAGTANGEIPESAGSAASHHNHYERTKFVSEQLVAAAPNMQVRILRPSIVIGHSETLAATSSTGMYGFLRELVTFRDEVSRLLGDLLALRPLRILADADTRLNLIPVNEVARQAVAISRSSSTATYFHITNPRPTFLGDAMRLAFNLLSLRQPLFATSIRELNAIDQALSDRIPFYGSYLTGTKLFARRNCDAALGTHWPGVDLSSDALQPYIAWYLRTLGVKEVDECMVATPR
ncbi:MAG TPA: SDR family oxidoreductase [Nitriliruptorales bacterium]|nr:SDR family oxidoreductase [Nitriliruptorales bacterium]